MALPPGTGAAVGTAIEPGVGTAIGSILETLSGLVKGKTQHYSAQQVEPIALNFESYMYPRFLTAYGASGILKMLPYVRSNFLVAVDTWWGIGSPGGKAFYTDLPMIDAARQKSPTNPSPLSWYLHDYVLFVLLNVDNASGADEQQKMLTGVFNAIFSNAIASAGLKPELVGKTSDIVPGSTGGGGTYNPAENGVVKAGFDTNIIFIVLFAGLAVALLTGKGATRK